MASYQSIIEKLVEKIGSLTLESTVLKSDLEEKEAELLELRGQVQNNLQESLDKQDELPLQ